MTVTATPRVHELLERFRGARVFFEPLAGNNGDILIEMGSRLALQQAGIDLAPSPVDADAVVMNGGFGISDLYPDGVRHLALASASWSRKGWPTTSPRLDQTGSGRPLCIVSAMQR